ncbi:MmgE/PrpD family protein [Chloroflexota bacterium]
MTEKIADFVVSTDYAKLPDEAVDTAKMAILDGLGVTLAGSRHPLGEAITGHVKELGGKTEASVIGCGFKTNAPQAALANGTMAHALDYDDASGWAFHPTAVLLPAILALGEANHISGKEALIAYVLGFEMATRLGMNVTERLATCGWHQTGVVGAMSVALACARILKLNKQQVRMTMGIAASMAAGVRINFGTMTKPLHGGNTARNGVVAAKLAASGITANEDILEAPGGYYSTFCAGSGYDLDQVLGGELGNPWILVSQGVIIKVYPACRGTHRCLDAALYLKHKYDLSAGDIAGVECITSDTLRTSLMYSRPKTTLEAKFCVEYCVAAALLDGHIGLQHFTEEKVFEPRVQEFLTRVKYVHPEELKGWQGRKKPETVTVKLKDGRQFSHSVDQAKGALENPTTYEEVLTKYRECAAFALSDDAVDNTIDLVANLEKVKDVAELGDMVIGSAKKRSTVRLS